MPSPPTVLIGAPQLLFREGLQRLLDSAGFDVVGQAADGDDLLRKTGAHRPGIVLVADIAPAAVSLRRRWPEMPLLVLERHVDAAAARALLAEDACGIGYLLEDRVADVPSFLDGLRRVAAGGSVLDPRVVTSLIPSAGADVLHALTPREREVLSLLAEGRSNRGIAERLVVTEHAVERHIGQILAKLGITASRHSHRRVLAVLTFLRARGYRYPHLPAAASAT